MVLLRNLGQRLGSLSRVRDETRLFAEGQGALVQRVLIVFADSESLRCRPLLEANHAPSLGLLGVGHVQPGNPKPVFAQLAFLRRHGELFASE